MNNMLGKGKWDLNNFRKHKPSNISWYDWLCNLREDWVFNHKKEFHDFLDFIESRFNEKAIFVV